MTTISLSELIILIITGGLGGAVARYLLDVRRARYEYVIKLHRRWCSAEFRQIRSEVYKIVEDFNSIDSSTKEANTFLSYVENGTLLQHPSGHSFVQIVFFFADINACLEKKLLDAGFTYRLFGASQYFWFQPLISAVREHLPNQTDDIRWKWETEKLEEKFRRFREKDSKEKKKLLGK